MQTIGGDKATAVVERETILREAQSQGATWSIDRWLAYLEAINPECMELGLDRIRQVAQRLDINSQLCSNDTVIVTVAGTNGKGSTSALIAQAFVNMGVKTGLYTSPHLYRFNERILLNGQEITDAELTECLNAVITAQGQGEETIFLTYFEITTLAAMLAFVRAHQQLLVLEVGLGGRLDAVNAFYNDLAIITSIGLDHVKILGADTAAIAHEKAGIIQKEGEVIVGANVDANALEAILDDVEAKDALVYLEGADFTLKEVEGEDTVCYNDSEVQCELYFPYPKIPFSCAGIALSAIFKVLMYFELPLQGYEELKAIEDALRTVALPGRMQHVASNPDIYLDVAHNVPAALHLRDKLLSRYAEAHPETAKRRAVIGMLKDKDVEGVLDVLKDSFEAFYVGSLHTLRGEDSERLATFLREHVKEGVTVEAFATVEEALHKAQADASAQDEIIVMGSFVTVSEAQKVLHLV